MKQYVFDVIGSVFEPDGHADGSRAVLALIPDDDWDVLAGPSTTRTESGTEYVGQRFCFVRDGRYVEFVIDDPWVLMDHPDVVASYVERARFALTEMEKMMTPEELAEAKKTGKAPCGCTRTVSEDGLSWSTGHDDDCALLKPAAGARTARTSGTETTTEPSTRTSGGASATVESPAPATRTGGTPPAPPSSESTTSRTSGTSTTTTTTESNPPPRRTTPS